MDTHEMDSHENDHHEKDQHESQGSVADETEDLKDISKVDTVAVNVENRAAYKGDDSDGRVDWTLKQVLATIFLSGLYVGKPTTKR
jgi:hypothetical protein